MTMEGGLQGCRLPYRDVGERSEMRVGLGTAHEMELKLNFFVLQLASNESKWSSTLNR
jgi:hypothetical protein